MTNIFSFYHPSCDRHHSSASSIFIIQVFFLPVMDSTPSPLQPSSSSVCSSTDACIIGESEPKPKSTAEEDDDGIQECIFFSKRIDKWIGFSLQKDWSIVKSALGEHRISCHLDLVNSSITFTTKRTREPDIAHKARNLLKLLAINVPAVLAINVITQPNHVWKIIYTGPKNGEQNGGLCARDPTITREDFLERVELLKSSAEDISRLTLCQILIGEFFVLTVGTSGGLRIVKKVVEDCILYRMPPADNIKFIRMQLATKNLEDLRL